MDPTPTFADTPQLAFARFVMAAAVASGQASPDQATRIGAEAARHLCDGRCGGTPTYRAKGCCTVCGGWLMTP